MTEERVEDSLGTVSYPEFQAQTEVRPEFKATSPGVGNQTAVPCLSLLLFQAAVSETLGLLQSLPSGSGHTDMEAVLLMPV